MFVGQIKAVIGFLHDGIDMGIPVSCYPKVVSCLHKRQVAIMDGVGGCN